MKNLLRLLLSCALVAIIQTVRGQVEFSIFPETGAIDSIFLKDDPRGMNWMQETDGSQYKWIGREYGWGLGFYSVVSGVDTLTHKWDKPLSVTVKRGRTVSRYLAGNIAITVSRRVQEGELIEEYTFTNRSHGTLRLIDIGINTPFNDNYPDAATCFRARANAHIWRGGHAAYVNAMHMSGRPPHLGLVVTDGAIVNYEIVERAREKANSNTRGVIILNPENITLPPGWNYTIAWRIFSHSGFDDFFARVLKHGSVVAHAEKYIYQQGETARVEFEHAGSVENPVVRLNGKIIPSRNEGNRIVATPQLNEPGEALFELEWGRGKSTPVYCRVIQGEEELIRKRAAFILSHQQLDNPADPRHGAYMVYDNETNRIYLNDTPNCNPVDRDEGRERVGMGVLLAMLYNRSEEKNEALKASLLRYSDFVHRLQDKDYNTFSNTALTGWNRNYNYAWVAHYYFEMFGVTGDRQFLLDGYHTLKALFRNFGHGFYAIGLPVQGYRLLMDNGFKEEAASLLEDFTKVADTYLRNGHNYPKSEVNYEQSIVAPSVTHLLNVYRLTGEQKYLHGARELLPLLEAFGGRQPDYHLNEISVRHWDGYWFGKREFWGDTFPHYWSVLTAAAYAGWADCTGDESYRQRARQIVRNNLCNFFEDGSASCAFIYPARVNGVDASFHDPYANDQDWALVYYLMVNRDTALFERGGTTFVWLDNDVEPVVRSAFEMLRGDVRTVFDAELRLTDDRRAARILIEGPRGAGRGSEATGEWEAFTIATRGGQLVIEGSDPRGTAYGLLEISRPIGVSPWEYWADATPARRDRFMLGEVTATRQSPSVQYRGIFLNDEDWGLLPWAMRNFEYELVEGVTLADNPRWTGAIGASAYEQIFRLMLRLRANTLWPAMHE